MRLPLAMQWAVSGLSAISRQRTASRRRWLPLLSMLRGVQTFTAHSSLLSWRVCSHSMTSREQVRASCGLMTWKLEIQLINSYLEPPYRLAPSCLCLM
jgi:hypothetical protein